MRNLALAVSALSLLAAGPALAQTGPMRDYPVVSPPPPNAVDLGAGVSQLPPGVVQLQPNMPGHRRFRPPQFPNAGWDSPLLPHGERDYDRYLVEYWKVPFLAPDAKNPEADGQEQRGYVAPEPWIAKVERSRATPDQEALMERRMAFITREVLNAVPLRNLHGASVEPELTITGYGQQYGAQGDGVMRGKILLQFRLISPSTGHNQRMPNGTIKSSYFGPAIRIDLNPDYISCVAPTDVSPAEVQCEDGDHRLIIATDRQLVEARGTSSSPTRGIVKAGYADGRPANDLRALFIWHDRNNNASSQISQGRMHPNDALGRVIGAVNLIDWHDLLRRAGEVQ